MSPDDVPDHYEILEVQPGASDAEIKRAWRRLVQQTHPDSGGSAALFRLVNEAYAVIGDPHRRAAYDRRRKGLQARREQAAEAAAAPRSTQRTRWETPDNAIPEPEPIPPSPTPVDDPAAWSWKILTAPAVIVGYLVIHLSLQATTEAAWRAGGLSSLGWNLLAVPFAIVGATMWIGVPVGLLISATALFRYTTARRRSDTTDPAQPSPLP